MNTYVFGGGLEEDSGSSTVSSSSKFKPLTIGYAGDSIANMWGEGEARSPMFWFTSLHYPCRTKDIFNESNPGTTSSNLLTVQIGLLEALEVKPELMIVHTTQNDALSTYAFAEASASNVTTYCDRALVSGVKNIIIAGHPPRFDMGTPSVLQYLNRILSSYADNTGGVHFLDVLSLWRAVPTGEDSEAGYIDWKADYSDDGVHPTSTASKELGALLIPILRPLVQSKELQPVTASEYDDTTTQYSNVLGATGLILGTSGLYNLVANPNLAGVDAGKWWLLADDTDAGGVTATPSIVVGDDGYNLQQLDLSGTSASDFTIELVCPFITAVSEGRFILEAILHLNDVVNVDSIEFGVDTVFSVLDITVDNHHLEGENKLHINLEKTTSSSGYRTLALKLNIKAGVTPSGIIQIGHAGIYRQVD